MVMKHGTSIEKHLKHMKEITDQLAAIGAPISEEDQVVTLLGIGCEFEFCSAGSNSRGAETEWTSES